MFGAGSGQAVDGADAQTMAAVKNVCFSCENHRERDFQHQQGAAYMNY
jgi:hypothetical protein